MIFFLLPYIHFFFHSPISEQKGKKNSLSYQLPELFCILSFFVSLPSLSFFFKPLIPPITQTFHLFLTRGVQRHKEPLENALIASLFLSLFHSSRFLCFSRPAHHFRSLPSPPSPPSLFPFSFLSLSSFSRHLFHVLRHSFAIVSHSPFPSHRFLFFSIPPSVIALVTPRCTRFLLNYSFANYKHLILTPLITFLPPCCSFWLLNNLFTTPYTPTHIIFFPLFIHYYFFLPFSLCNTSSLHMSVTNALITFIITFIFFLAVAWLLSPTILRSFVFFFSLSLLPFRLQTTLYYHLSLILFS